MDVPPPPPPEDFNPVPGYWYSAEGELLADQSRSRSHSPSPHYTPPPPLLDLAEQTDSEEDEAALFEASLWAGEESRLRRAESRAGRGRGRGRRGGEGQLSEDDERGAASWRDEWPVRAWEAGGGAGWRDTPLPPPAAAGAAAGGAGDQVEDDTGWIVIPGPLAPPSFDTRDSPSLSPPPAPLLDLWDAEISPEEEEAERRYEASRRDRRARRFEAEANAAAEDETVTRAREYADEVMAEWEEQEERRGSAGTGVWRNTPLSLPRLSSLPRGGRSYAAATSSSFSNPSTYSPLNPPPSAPSTRFATLPRSQLGTTTTVTYRNSLDRSASPPPLTTRSAAPAERLQFHVLPRGLDAPPPFAPLSPPQGRRRRTREETNAMMGHSLRSGKGVYSLYCGGDGGEGEGGEGEVPEGFYRAQGGEGGGRKGCGALVCARALVEGVPRKVFDDGDGKKGKGREEEAVSSDLPPHGGRVGDWDDGTTEEGAERVGRRGWKGCKGCVTKDVGCKRCGNHLGYRLLRPCVTCSISRPAYTYSSYASVVNHPSSFLSSASSGPSSSSPSTSSSTSTTNPAATNLFTDFSSTAYSDAPFIPPPPISSARGPVPPPPEANANAPTLSAGGVTGGGLADGLLFHFRRGSVTVLPRRVGVRPAEEVGEEKAREAAREGGGDGEGGEEGEGEGQRIGAGGAGDGRTRAGKGRGTEEGERMKWKAIPSAQADFLATLLGDPSDWITPSGETWWLDASVAKHSLRHSASAAAAAAGRGGIKRDAGEAELGIDAHSSDRLSTATTSVPSGSGSGASLSRSGAIRHRPSSSVSSPATADTSNPGDAYDRYRLDASPFARRVRQRTSTSTFPSAFSGGFEGDDGDGESGRAVLRALERAGYGEGFGEAPEEVLARTSGGVRRRRTGGAVGVGGRGSGRRESTGR